MPINAIKQNVLTEYDAHALGTRIALEMQKNKTTDLIGEGWDNADVENIINYCDSSSLHPTQFVNSKMERHFLRGFVETLNVSKIIVDGDVPYCRTGSFNAQMTEYMLENYRARRRNSDPDIVEWEGITALDFLGLLYSDATHYDTNMYQCYKKLCNASFQYKLVDKLAKAPSRNNSSDSGWDLHLIRKIKDPGDLTECTNSSEVGDVEYYDTGIQLEPEYGYYFELIGRSSISRSGYMLANSVGIIDAGYRGNIIVALVKLKEKSRLSLPVKLVQLIPRKNINIIAVEGGVSDTVRGNGGFGSTNKKL